VVLGCTEIGLLLHQHDLPRVPLLDSTALHVELAVRVALGLAPPPALRAAEPEGREAIVNPRRRGLLVE
jgi:hypothetical protein